jgi:hypothetical protein
MAGGMMDNVISSKLYRSGSIGYVSRSGGMSNELNNICCRNGMSLADNVSYWLRNCYVVLVCAEILQSCNPTVHSA